MSYNPFDLSLYKRKRSDAPVQDWIKSYCTKRPSGCWAAWGVDVKPTTEFSQWPTICVSKRERVYYDNITPNYPLYVFSRRGTGGGGGQKFFRPITWDETQSGIRPDDRIGITSYRQVTRPDGSDSAYLYYRSKGQDFVNPGQILPVWPMLKVEMSYTIEPGLFFYEAGIGMCPDPQDGNYREGNPITSQGGSVSNMALPRGDALDAYTPSWVWDFVQEVYPHLLVEADAKAKKGFDILTFIAEGNKTLEFIAQNARRVRNLFRGKLFERERKRSRKPKKFGEGIKPGFEPLGPKDLASAWMEYRYAFSPLMYSIEDAAIWLRNSYAKYQRGTAYRIKSSTHVVPGASNNWYGGPVQYELTYETTVLVRAGVMYKVDMSFMAGLQMNLGTTAWELVPFSWMCDWVWKVGDWITSLTPQPGYYRVHSWVSVKIVTKVTGCKVTNPVGGVAYGPNGSYARFSPGGVSGSRTVKYRFPANPDHYAAWPEWKINFNKERAADSLAVLYQTLTGKRR